MQCHKCAHRADLKAGRFKNLPFEQTPCSKCHLEEESDFVMPILDNLIGSTKATAGQGAGLPPDENIKIPLWTLGVFVRRLLSLQPLIRDAVGWRANGLSLADIARRQGCSPGLVDKRLKRAIEDWPELNALFLKRAVCVARRKTGAWKYSPRCMHKTTGKKINDFQERDQVEK